MTSSSIHNPWREFIENCLDGSNYFRSGEYYQLLDDLDRGYAAQDRLLLLRELLVKANGHVVGQLRDEIATALENTGG